MACDGMELALAQGMSDRYSTPLALCAIMSDGLATAEELTVVRPAESRNDHLDSYPLWLTLFFPLFIRTEMLIRSCAKLFLSNAVGTKAV